MFGLLKTGSLTGIRWFEWLFIGVFFTVCIWGYYNSEKIERLLSENTELHVQYEIEKQSNNQRQESFAISDEIATEFVREMVEAQYNQQLKRQEATDEFLSILHSRAARSVSNTDDPRSEPVPKPSGQLPAVEVETVIKTVDRIPQLPSVDQKLHSIALTRLSERMLEGYCQAQFGGECPSR